MDWFRNHNSKLVRKCFEEGLDFEQAGEGGGVVICNPPFVLHLPLYMQDADDILHDVVGEEEELVGFEEVVVGDEEG
ncbi:hypothetical protein EON64_14350, partial [archaeon]